MRCSFCQSAGYNLPKIDGKIWCGSCEQTTGTRTLSRTNSVGSERGYVPIRGIGALAALPKLCSLAEWQEIATLCKKASNPKLLTEDGPIKTLPLPDHKNPLNEKPSDKRDGWMPLTEYFQNLNTEKTSKKEDNIPKLRNLFEG